MKWLVHTIGAVYELARLGCVSGFRFSGPYWSWRLHTAFGRGYPTSRAELIHAVLEYGRWIYRTRRGG